MRPEQINANTRRIMEASEPPEQSEIGVVLVVGWSSGPLTNHTRFFIPQIYRNALDFRKDLLSKPVKGVTDVLVMYCQMVIDIQGDVDDIYLMSHDGIDSIHYRREGEDKCVRLWSTRNYDNRWIIKGYYKDKDGKIVVWGTTDGMVALS